MAGLPTHTFLLYSQIPAICFWNFLATIVIKKLKMIIITCKKACSFFCVLIYQSGTLSVSSQSHHHYVHIIVERRGVCSLLLGSRVLMLLCCSSVHKIMSQLVTQREVSRIQPTISPGKMRETCVSTHTLTHIACEKSLCFI